MNQTRSSFLAVVALFVLCAFCSFRPVADGHRYAVYCVAFYNQENLFDTIHDEVSDTVEGRVVKVADKNDYEYLPDGAMHWNTMKYKAKLKNMSEAISRIATDKLPLGPAVIGLSEVENARVLADLVAQPALAARGLKFIHVEGPDFRGIDCAFLYNPRLFKYSHCRLVPYVYPPEEAANHATRGFLIATGKMAGDDFHLIVCHWPSRAAASSVRERAGAQVRAIKDSLLRENPDCKIVIMGDLNDDPDDKSIAGSLGARRKMQDCTAAADLWNPWWDMLRKNGVGTLKYNGKWNLFDQIILNGNLVGDDFSTLRYYRHEVFNPDFLMQQEGKYKGYPKRTHASGVWLNGYSDHLPTIVYFRKQVD